MKLSLPVLISSQRLPNAIDMRRLLSIIIFTSPSAGVRCIGMSVCVCLFVCLPVCLSARTSQKPHLQTSRNFLRMAPFRGSILLRRQCISGFVDDVMCVPERREDSVTACRSRGWLLAWWRAWASRLASAPGAKCAIHDDLVNLCQLIS